MREVEDPITEPDGRDGTRTTHPAFGQISASRRQGGEMSLYGSDFVHNNTIAITISSSELNRGLSRDWFYPKREIVEIVLSESQWATFVSSLNMGSGPCCTIQQVCGERKPSLPMPEDRKKQYSGELAKTLQSSLDRIDGAMEKVLAAGLSTKKTEEIMGGLRMARQELKSNVPFVSRSFDENMEDTVEKAKQEIHGYLNGQISRAGLTALRSSEEVISLEFNEHGND